MNIEITSELFRSLFKNTSGIIIYTLDKDYCYTFFSESYKNLIRQFIGEEIAIGQKVIFTKENLSPRDAFNSKFDKALTKIFTELESYQDSVGNQKVFDVQYGPIQNSNHEVIGISAVLVDVTTLHPNRNVFGQDSTDSDSSINETELVKLSLIARHTSNAVIITDAEGRIEWVNEGFTRITEYKLEEVTGKKPGPLLQGKESDTIAVNFLRNKIRAKESFEVELINYTKSGKKYWIQINGRPIFNNKGEVIKYFAIESDITARKLSEIKIREQNTGLTAITENLTRKNEQLEEFTQIVSHNLRSPMGNISALIEHLNFTTDEAEKRELIEHLKTSSDSLMLTLNELNEVLKIKYAGHIEKELVNLEKVFHRVRGMLRLQINETEAEVSADFSKAPTVLYPSIYIESIFLNFLSNALKYYSKQRKPLIRFETWLEDGAVHLKASDNGLGIDLARYGHQVFKLRKTFHAHPESRGVGLFMVKNQVEVMGGAISLKSEVNNGTTFFVNFGSSE